MWEKPPSLAAATTSGVMFSATPWLKASSAVWSTAVTPSMAAASFATSSPAPATITVTGPPTCVAAVTHARVSPASLPSACAATTSVDALRRAWAESVRRASAVAVRESMVSFVRALATGRRVQPDRAKETVSVVYYLENNALHVQMERSANRGGEVELSTGGASSASARGDDGACARYCMEGSRGCWGDAPLEQFEGSPHASHFTFSPF